MIATGVIEIGIEEISGAAKGCAVTSVPWRESTDLSEAVAKVGKALRVGGVRTIDVRIGSALVQQRSLSCGRGTSLRALRRLTRSFPETFFRKRGGPLISNVVRGKGEDGGALAVAVELGVVEAGLLGARQVGLRIRRVGASLPVGDAALRANLLPLEELTRRRQRIAKAGTLFARAALGGWMMAILVVTGVDVAKHRCASAQLAEFAPTQDALARLGASMSGAQEMLGAVTSTYAARGRVLQGLAAISSAVRGNAFITSITLNADSTCVVTGTAIHAAQALALLETSGWPLLPKAEQGSSRLSENGAEDFAFSCGWASP